jgi:hypothetical protein
MKGKIKKMFYFWISINAEFLERIKTFQHCIYNIFYTITEIQEEVLKGKSASFASTALRQIASSNTSSFDNKLNELKSS